MLRIRFSRRFGWYATFSEGGITVRTSGADTREQAESDALSLVRSLTR